MNHLRKDHGENKNNNNLQAFYWILREYSVLKMVYIGLESPQSVTIKFCNQHSCTKYMQNNRDANEDVINISTLETVCKMFT